MTAKIKKDKRPELDNVLLCLVRLNDNVSGYQLHQLISELTGYFYQAHLSQIYPALKRLHEDGLVTFSEVAREGKPDLKLYRITDSGISVAREWLMSPFNFGSSHNSINHFFLRLVLMGDMEDEYVLRFIDEGIENLSRLREQYSQAKPDKQMERLDEKDVRVRTRYAAIWGEEASYVREARDLQIAHLNKIRDKLQAQMG